MDIDKMKAGKEMDVIVHTEVFGEPRNVPAMRDPEYLYKSSEAGWVKIEAPPYSTDISVAWQVDKPDWYWVFTEMPNKLQITLYPSREAWDKRPFEMYPYPKETIHVDVNWNDHKTKAEVYALGRCRAALKAVQMVDIFGLGNG